MPLQIKDFVAKNLKINGNKVIGRIFKGKDFSKKDIETLTKQFQTKYSDKNLTVMLGVNTPFGFRNSKAFQLNDNFQSVDDYEWDTTDTFIIYGWKSPILEGGCGNNNDCLFECIKKVMNYYRLPKNIKTDKALKAILKLNENDKIHVNRIPEIERLFKLNVYISGDFVYTSKNKFDMNIHLKLTNEHFEIEPNNNKSADLLKHMPKKKQNLILVELQNSNVKCYDGKQIFYISYDEYHLQKKDFYGKNVYLENTPFEKSENIEDDYNYFIEQIEILKNETNGKIDLSMSGYKITNEALKCIHYSLLAFDEPEELDNHEQKWIYNCFKGGLIFCENDITLDDAYSYDLKSAYPSMMQNDHFKFPIKQGNFSKLSFLPNSDKLKCGIYKCIISKSGEENIDKLFRFNKSNYYTHYDIKIARKLNLDIELIDGEESNALIYDTNKCVKGSTYFLQIVQQLYNLKTKSKLAKKILNAIWGALSQRNKIIKTTYKSREFNEAETIIGITPIGENEHKITYLKNGKYFKFPYARLGVFLTSAVRKQMAEYILPYKENVKKCHTDSILSDKQLDDLPIGKFIGNFALENQGKCHIKNSSSKVIFL